MEMMAILGLLQLASGGMKAFGQLSERNAQAQAAERNAQIMRQQAGLVAQAGEFDVKRLQKQKSSFEGLQRVLFAKGGVSSQSGSPLAVIADSAAEFELDIASSRFNTQINQMRLFSQAGEDVRLAQRARSAGKMEAFTTLLDTGSSFLTNRSVGQRET